MKKKRRGRGEGSIHQRGEQWVGSVTIGYYANGNPKRKVVYGATKSAVQQKLDEIRTAHRTGTLSQSKLSVSEFIDYWLDNAIRERKDAGTEALYRQRATDYIKPHVGHVGLVKLSDVHVDTLLSTLRASGKSLDLVRKVGELLRRALRYGIKKGWIFDNAASKVDLPTVIVREIHPLDERQVQQFLLVASSNRLFPLYQLALDTGMRQGEIIALEWTDLDLEGGFVQVRKSAKSGSAGGVRIKDVKTAASRRRIRLSQRTVAILKEWKQQCPGKIVFPNRGRGLNYGKDRYLIKGCLLRSFKKLLKKAKLPEIRFHDLRHTHATLALLKTKNVKAISARLGHKDIRVTLNTYSHVLPAMEDEVVAAMESVLVPAAKMPEEVVAVA